MDDMEQAMRTVRYPAMRREVMGALAALGDRDYQLSVWIEKIYPTRTYYDDLTQNIHILYDDCKVLPNPSGRLHSVLVGLDEVSRLIRLDSALSPLLSELRDAPDAAYVADPRWPGVMTAATSALLSMVLAGAYVDA